MSIDFASPKEYLSNKLDDLLEGISDSYGTLLMEELISRLEATITDFNNEMSSMMEHIKENSRQNMLKKIKSGDSIEDKSDTIEKPVWEDKIEKLEKKKK